MNKSNNDLRGSQKIADILVYSNTLIALAALSQSALTYLVLTIPPSPWVLTVEFCSTFLLYNFSLLIIRPKNPAQSPFERTRWYYRHEHILRVLSAVAGVALIIAVLHLHFYTMQFLAGVGIFSFLYNFPFLPSKHGKEGLRKIPLLKIFHISILWSLSTVGLPVVESLFTEHAINWFDANYLGILKILFILLCTLPFDVRDMEQDRYYNLRTIPTVFGMEKSIQLNYIVLSLHSVCVLLSPYAIAIKTGLIITNVLIAIVLKTIVYNPKNQQYNRVYILDFVLVAQYVITYAYLLLNGAVKA